MDPILRKIYESKKTKQLFISLPRKILDIKKGTTPKKISFEIKEIEW